MLGADNLTPPPFSISQISTLPTRVCGRPRRLRGRGPRRDRDLGAEAAGRRGRRRGPRGVRAQRARGRGGGPGPPLDPAAAAARRADDPAERIEALAASIHRLAAFGPEGIVCLTGSGLGLAPERARELVVEGLATLALEARARGRPDRARALPGRRRRRVVDRLLDPRGGLADRRTPAATPALGLQFDVWHLWNSPTVLDDIAAELPRIAGVHVCDVRQPTRSWC